MLNQYSTLVLNLAGAESTFGSPGYQPLQLPMELQLFYDLLFPKNSSDYHKQFLMYGYLRLIEAAGSKAEMYRDDSRITYDLNSVTDFFRTNRTVKKGDSSYDMFIYGTLIKDETTSYYFDSFDIMQLGLTPKVLIYSNVTKQYLNGAASVPSPTPACEISLTLDASGNLTKPVRIGSSGLSFCLAGDFTKFNDETKSWTVIAESPFVFDFPKIMNRIVANYGIVEGMLNYGGVSATGHEAVYQGYFNSVYRFAALLHCYYHKVLKQWH